MHLYDLHCYDAANADGFGVLSTSRGIEGPLLTLEAQQPMSRPLNPGSFLADQWNKVPDKVEVGSLNGDMEPDRACLQLLKICGQMDLDGAPFSIFYTDYVSQPWTVLQTGKRQEGIDSSRAWTNPRHLLCSRLDFVVLHSILDPRLYSQVNLSIGHTCASSVTTVPAAYHHWLIRSHAYAMLAGFLAYAF